MTEQKPITPEGGQAAHTGVGIPEQQMPGVESTVSPRIMPPRPEVVSVVLSAAGAEVEPTNNLDVAYAAKVGPKSEGLPYRYGPEDQGRGDDVCIVNDPLRLLVLCDGVSSTKPDPNQEETVYDLRGRDAAELAAQTVQTEMQKMHDAAGDISTLSPQDAGERLRRAAQTAHEAVLNKFEGRAATMLLAAVLYPYEGDMVEYKGRTFFVFLCVGDSVADVCMIDPKTGEVTEYSPVTRPEQGYDDAGCLVPANAVGRAGKYGGCIIAQAEYTSLEPGAFGVLRTDGVRPRKGRPFGAWDLRKGIAGARNPQGIADKLVAMAALARDEASGVLRDALEGESDEDDATVVVARAK